MSGELGDISNESGETKGFDTILDDFLTNFFFFFTGANFISLVFRSVWIELKISEYYLVCASAGVWVMIVPNSFSRSAKISAWI